MRKVLIITYYWPPSGGSGVQRWLKFVKYLPAYGWQPHVFTPENPSFAVRDSSLEKDVPSEAEIIRFPIWEPYDIFNKMSGWFGSKKKESAASLVSVKNKSFFHNISAWIRGNFFIPDPRRFWIKPAVNFLSDYLIDNEIETIITSGPPHSLHMIGLKLKSKFPHLRWLADFRDPWTEWGLWDSLRVSSPVRWLHRRLESRVLAAADEIITITPFYVRQFERLSNRKVELLTNGFDTEDFEGMTCSTPEKFIIRHVGIVNERCDPRPFMTALKNEMEADPGFARDLRMEFIGEVHPDFRRYVSNTERLKHVTFFPGNIAHKDLISLYGSSCMFLLILTGYKDGEGFLPGKLFEYIATRLPVLGIGPAQSDAAALLKETGSGSVIESDDEKAIRQQVRATYGKWRKHEKLQVNGEKLEKYSRRDITRQLTFLLSR